MIYRVVFDTSVLVSAILKPGSNPHLAIQRALRSCVLVSCEQLIAELDEVLSRPYFDGRLSRSHRNDFIALIRQTSALVPVDAAIAVAIDPSCRDKEDNFILALAVLAGADAIVSSDNDLLILNPWNGIPILTPAEFLEQFPT